MSYELTGDKYFTGLRREFTAAHNRDESARMSRYLRDQFHFLGIRTPERRAIQKRFREAHGELHPDALHRFVKRCWADEHRELQYAGIDLAIRQSKKAPEERWELYEWMVVNKSWWDSVDMVATTLMTTHLQRFRGLNPALPDRWINDESIWLKRTALLFQLKYRLDTNTRQLFGYIDAVRDSDEFFLQKAAGWALREYSRHDPDVVRDYIARTDLPALTVREGLKFLNRNK